MSLFGIYEDRIIELIDHYHPILRQRKVDTRYCLGQVCKVLTSGMRWLDLDSSRCHATTIYKRFLSWSKTQVLAKVWAHLLDEYTQLQMRSCPTFFRTLFIDASMVSNHHGVDGTGYNHYDRNRQGTKLSIICDMCEVPLAIVFAPANVHDKRLVLETIEAIASPIRVNNRHTHDLIGDRGYIMATAERNSFLTNHRMRIVTELKKNMRRKVRSADREKLRIRSKIEHVFCRLDKFRRIRYRDECRLSNFKSFHFLALAIIVVKKLNNLCR